MIAKDSNLLFLGIGTAAIWGIAHYRAAAQPPSALSAQTASVVAATNAFLSSLDAAQREKVQFPFTLHKTATAATFARSGGNPGPGGSDGRQGGPGRPGGDGRQGGSDGGRQGRGGGPRAGGVGGFIGEQYGQAVWSNFPVSDVPRPGLALGSLSGPQREAAMHLLQIVLSSRGYQKVSEIMDSDQALSDGGTPFSSGINAYTLGVFGKPSVSTPWMLQYGGHHLALNITVVAEHGTITPTLTGAQPAVYMSKGKTVRALAQENDKAFTLLNALDENQRKQALLNYLVGDLVLGPGQAGKTIQPEGLKASALNERQRTLLLDVIQNGLASSTTFMPHPEWRKS